MMNEEGFDVSPSVLRSYVTVSTLRSFTAAAAQLGLQQSTISQHVKRLEQAFGRKLLNRDTHAVSLTSDGDAMVEFAQNVLDANLRMERFFTTKVERSRLRLGISEDFAMSGLAEVLTAFQDLEPDIELELTVGLSGLLYQGFDAGELDIIFAKRKPGDKRGRIAWSESLVWIGRPNVRLDREEPVPLVAYAPPSITRTLAIKALEKSNKRWRVSCSSGSLNGLHAALIAGLGVAAHSRRLMPPGLAPVAESAGLPPLPSVEFVALGPTRGNGAATRMMDMLVDRQDSLVWAKRSR